MINVPRKSSTLLVINNTAIISFDVMNLKKDWAPVQFPPAGRVQLKDA